MAERFSGGKGGPRRSGGEGRRRPDLRGPGRPTEARRGRPPRGEALREPAERPLPPDDVCWGRQPVLDLVRNTPSRCTRLLIANNVRPPYLDELVDLARAGRVVYQLVAPEALEKLCPGERHQGVACRLTETVAVLPIRALVHDTAKLPSIRVSFPWERRFLFPGTALP